jgi:hypothetical protein
LIAATTCAAVLVNAPVASVASDTLTVSPTTDTARGRSKRPWVEQLDRDVVAALVTPRE